MQANKKLELHYWLGDNPNLDTGATAAQWYKATNSAGKNAIVSVDFEHSMGKPAEAKITLINSVPNFRAADAASYSGYLSTMLTADDAGTNSPLFTDFMRVKLIDAHSRLVILYGI